MSNHPASCGPTRTHSLTPPEVSLVVCRGLSPFLLVLCTGLRVLRAHCRPTPALSGNPLTPSTRPPPMANLTHPLTTYTRVNPRVLSLRLVTLGIPLGKLPFHCIFRLHFDTPGFHLVYCTTPVQF